MSLTPRDLKDITDLVSKKLEIYLNIDERERHFNTEGCYRVSPRMHKYDVMYRLLESREYEKTLQKTPRTPRSKTPVSTRSRSRTSKSPYSVCPVSIRSNSNDKTTTKLSQGQRSSRSKTPTKTKCVESFRVERSRTPKKDKPTSFVVKEKKKEEKRPISVKTPRTPRSNVGNKQAKRLENYANLVYEEFPVKDLQQIHHQCPNLPEAGKVQNYTRHVGSALNTKHYVDFYLKKGLAGDKRRHGGQKKAQNVSTINNNLGSMSGSDIDGSRGDQDYSQTYPESESTRSALVRFISPESSVQSNLNQETLKSSNNIQTASQLNKPDQDIAYVRNESRSEMESPFPRCRSRISRKTSSLNISYSSNSSEDPPTTSDPEDQLIQSDTSTRTNSPESPRESLLTPSSYCEADSSDSSGSSVLRYYRLSTQSYGTVQKPRPKSFPKSKSEKHSQMEMKSGQFYHPGLLKSEDKLYSPRSRSLKRSNNEEKNQSEYVYHPVSNRTNCKAYSAHKTQSRHEDDFSSSSCSSTPRYKITARPSPRLLRRSSVRTNSMTESNGDSRTSTPRVETKSAMKSPRFVNIKQTGKQNIDLNLTAVLKRENCKPGIGGTGDDDVFMDRDTSENISGDEVFENVERWDDELSTESKVSRGAPGEDSDSFSSNTRLTREEYYKLQRSSEPLEEGVPSRKSTQRAQSISGEAHCYSTDTSSVESRGSCPCLGETTYSTAETLVLPAKEPDTENEPDTQFEISNYNDRNFTRDCSLKVNFEEGTSPEWPKTELSDPAKDMNEPPAEEKTSGVSLIKQVNNDEVESKKDNTNTLYPDSMSEAESVNRGSDGQPNDGRGKGRVVSAKRRQSRGCQWEDEDELPNNRKSGLRYRLGSAASRDERGGYDFLPENRGSSTEKGWEENAAEYYIVTLPENAASPTPTPPSSPCSRGIPPVKWNKSRESPCKSSPNDATSGQNKDTRADDLNEESCKPSSTSSDCTNVDELGGEDGGVRNELGYRQYAEVYYPASEDNYIQHHLGGNDEVRGESTSAVFVNDKDYPPSLLLKYRDSLPLSDKEIAMVLDMQEKTDEFRGNIETNDSNNPEGSENHPENILGRGLPRVSSVTSTLSWAEKYSGDEEFATAVVEENKKNQSEMEKEDLTKEESKVENINKEKCMPCPDREIRGETRDSREGSTGRFEDDEQVSVPETEDQLVMPILDDSDRRVDAMLSQIELLVRAKTLHLEVKNEVEDDCVCRGEDTDVDDSERQMKQTDDIVTRAYSPSTSSSLVPTSSYTKSEYTDLSESLVHGSKSDLLKQKSICDSNSEPKERKNQDSPKNNIRLLNTPCLVVSRSDSGPVVDLNKLKQSHSQKPKYKSNLHKRGEDSTSSKSRRPRSAVLKSTNTAKATRRRRSKSATSRSSK